MCTTQRDTTKRAARHTTAVPLSIPFGEVYAVTLQQPWASAVVAGAQPIVNRAVKLAIPPGVLGGVWLAVHAAQATDECARCAKGDDPALQARAAHFPAMHSPWDLPRGRLIGAMRVVRCVAFEKNGDALGADAAPWADGPLCWVIDRSVAVGAAGEGGDDADARCLRVEMPQTGEDCEAWRVENARAAELLKRAMTEEDARSAAALRAPHVLRNAAKGARAAVSAAAASRLSTRRALPAPSAEAERPARQRSTTRLEPAKKRTKVHAQQAQSSKARMNNNMSALDSIFGGPSDESR